MHVRIRKTVAAGLATCAAAITMAAADTPAAADGGHQHAPLSTDLSLYLLSKIQRFKQTTAAAPVPGDYFGDDNFAMSVAVQATSPTSLDGVIVTVPAPGDPVTLVNYDGWWQGGADSSVQSSIDALFPDGTYSFAIDPAHDNGGAVVNASLDLVGDSYPPAPTIANWTELQSADATVPVTISWTPWAQGAVTDSIFVEVFVHQEGGSGPREKLWEVPPGSIDGTAMQVVVPADTLAADGSYFGEVSFLKAVDMDTAAYPGAMGLAWYMASTVFPITVATSAGSNFTGGDDFDDDQKDTAKWGDDEVQGNAALTETSGRLEYTSDAGPESGAARVWSVNHGSYIENWAVQVDAAVGDLPLTTNDQRVDLEMIVRNNDDPERDRIEIKLRLSREAETARRFFAASVSVDDTWLAPERIDRDTSAQAGGLRLTFAAESKVLTAWYSETTRAQGYQWQLLRQVDLNEAGSDWQMSDEATFTVLIGGSSNGFAVASTDDVFLDNLEAALIANSGPPVAAAGGPYTVGGDGTVQLNASGTVDPDQETAALIYTWDLDDDGIFGEIGASAARGDELGLTPTYAATGLGWPMSRSVSLRVTDAGGLTSTASAAVEVVAPASNPGDVIYVADYNANTIEKFDVYGNRSAFAAVTQPTGLTLDEDGNLYVTLYNSTIRKIGPSGEDLGVFAASGLNYPYGPVRDSLGNLYVGNVGGGDNGRSVHRFSALGDDLGSFGTERIGAFGLAFDGSGDLYVTDSAGSGSIHRYSATGTDLGVFATNVPSPFGIAFDSAGNLFVSSQTANAVKKFGPAGSYLGSLEFPASGANGATALALDSAGNLYVARYNGSIRRFGPTGDDLGIFAAGLARPIGIAIYRTDWVVSEHVFNFDMSMGIEYGNPANDGDTQYRFEFSATTDSAVTAVALHTPGDLSFTIAPGAPSDWQQAGTAFFRVDSRDDQGGDQRKWEVQVRFPTDADAEAACGFGWYTVDLTHGDNQMTPTQVWLGSYDVDGAPVADQDIPKPTVEPVLTAPINGQIVAASPTNLTVSWDAVTDANAQALHIGVRSRMVDHDELDYLTPELDAGSQTFDGLTTGLWEVEAGYGSGYGLDGQSTPLNADGVPVQVIRYTSSTYTITVGPTHTIQGTVIAGNAPAAPLFLVLQASECGDTIVAVRLVTGPGSYLLMGVPEWPNYQVSAFFDLDGNGQGDATDLWAVCSGNTLSLDSDKTGVDVTFPGGHFTGQDDFSDERRDLAKWGSDFSLGDAVLTETGGHLEYTAPGSAMAEIADWQWTPNYGSYVHDWIARVDVNLSELSLTADDQQVSVGLKVVNNSDQRDQFQVPLVIARQAGVAQRNFFAFVITDNVYLEPAASQPTALLSAALRITFEAATKTLRAWYGEAPGDQHQDGSWTLLGAVDVTALASDWQMNDSSTFRVSLGGAADFRTVGSADQVYFDNFQLDTPEATDLTLYLLSKIQRFKQTTSAAPVPGDYFGDDNFAFSAAAQAASPTSLDGIVVTVPAPGTPVALTNYNGWWQGGENSADQAGLDAAFPNGTYTVAIDPTRDNEGAAVSAELSLVGDEYPMPPTISNWTQLQSADATAPLTISWTPWPQGTALDTIFVEVFVHQEGAGDGPREALWQSPGGSLDGTVTQVVVPAGILAAGGACFGEVSFMKAVDVNVTAYPGAIGLAWYMASTVFPIATATPNVPPLARDDDYATEPGETLIVDAGWTGQPEIAAMPTARAGGVAVVIDNQLYVAGGFTVAGGDTPVFEKYDPASNSWSTLAPLPDTDSGRDGRYNSAAGVIDGKLYLAGGWRTEPALPTRSLLIYDPALGTWSQGADLPQLSAGSVGAAIRRRFYVLTAFDGGSGTRNLLHAYDPDTNTWTEQAPAPHDHADGQVAVIDGRMYVAGGNEEGVSHTFLDVYDPAANSWSTMADLPRTRGAGAAAVANGRLYLFGGNSGHGPLVDQLDVYDPGTDTWSTLGSTLPTPRAGVNAGTIGGKVYVAAGFDADQAASAALEVYGAGGVLDNDSDADGDALTAVKVTDPAHGTLTLEADGGFTYEPEANFSGTDSFTYMANDGVVDSAPATVTLTVGSIHEIRVYRTLTQSGADQSLSAFCKIELKAAPGKTVTVTVPTNPLTTVQLNEDQNDPGSYTYDAAAADLADLDSRYPQGDYIFRVYTGTATGEPAEEDVVNFGDGAGAPLPFPDAFAGLTAPADPDHDLAVVATPSQVFAWDSFVDAGGTTGWATHTALRISDRDTGQALAEVWLGLDETPAFAPEFLLLAGRRYRVDVSFLYVRDSSAARAAGLRALVINERQTIYDTTAASADVALYLLSKIRRFKQTTAGAPLPGDYFGDDNFAFSAAVAGTSPASVEAVTVTVPAPGDPVTLTNYSGWWEGGEDSADQAGLDAAFPNGTYTVAIDPAHDNGGAVVNVSLNLVGDSYPSAPSISNWSELLGIDASAPLTVSWTPWAQGTATDTIFVEVFVHQAGAGDGPRETLWESPAGSLDGAATQVVVPAETLAAGGACFGEVSFMKAVDVNVTAYPGAIGLAWYMASTVFPITVGSNFDGGDDFDDNQKDTAKWGDDYVQGNAALTETSGRLQYTSDAGEETGAARIWRHRYGSYTEDWAIEVEAAVGDQPLTTDGQRVDVEMIVWNNDDPDRDWTEVKLRVSREGGAARRFFAASVSVDDAWLAPERIDRDTSTQAGGLRLSFAAETKTLSAWYSETASDQGYHWQLLRQVDLDAEGSDWQMSDAATFTVVISGSSAGFAVGAGANVYLDNFQSVPPPVVISGLITLDAAPLSGVEMSGLPNNPQTDAAGFYAASIDAGWSGMVTPHKAGLVFTPPSRVYAGVTSSQANQDYAASVLVDTDLDTLDDNWEMAHFGDLHFRANDDPDGDGLTNFEEYEAGTDPMGYEIRLHRGWNLVSTGHALTDSEVAHLFVDGGGLPAVAGMAWTWDGEKQRYRRVTVLEPHRGYWVFAPADAVVIVHLN